jgi:pilus assembly protein CpaB
VSDTPAFPSGPWTPPDPEPDWGPGLAYLTGRPERPATGGLLPPPGPAAGVLVPVGSLADAELTWSAPGPPPVRLPGGGAVATWLPDGRWLDPAAEGEQPDDGPQPPPRHRRDRPGGRRRWWRAASRSTATQPEPDDEPAVGRQHEAGSAARPVAPGPAEAVLRPVAAGPGGEARRPVAAGPGGAVRRRVRLAGVGSRVAGWPRRVVAAGLLLAAVLVGLRPDPPLAEPAPAGATVEVVVAGRDLAAGTELAAADLRTVSLPPAAVPAGATGRRAGLIGRRAAGAVRRGEVLTDARLVGPGLTAGLRPGEAAAVPVRVAEPEAAALVRPGDRVDVLGVPVLPDGAPTAGDAVEVAGGVRVLAVLGRTADGVVLVVAAPAPVARRLAGAAAQRLTVTVRPP